MAQFVIANNVNTQLAAALPASGAGSTTVVLASSANLPTLNTATGQMMPLTLNDAATGAIYETVYVTAISGATLTVLRGQEGTSALNWNVGDFALCGPTAGTSGLTTMRTQYQASATFSSSQTLTAAIAGESIGFTGSSAATFSMPGQSTVPALTPTAVYNDGSAALTLTANGSDKFVVATGQVTSIVMQPGDDLSFYASATSGQWQATAGSALRQYEPLVIGAATASQHAVQLGQLGHGQCRLSVTSHTVLTLKPQNGNNVIVNGVPLQIPSAGVAYTLSGLAASTVYYVYLGGTTAAPVLTVSATGHSTASNGVETMTGDTTKTLVGMVRTNASTQFVNSVTQRFCINWFNRTNLSCQFALATTISFTNTTSALLSATFIVEFITWSEDSILVIFDGTCQNNTAGNAVQLVSGADGVSNIGSPQQFNAATGGYGGNFSTSYNNQFAEGYHYTSLFGNVNGGTGSIVQGSQTKSTILG